MQSVLCTLCDITLLILAVKSSHICVMLALWFYYDRNHFWSHLTGSQIPV